MAKKKRSKRSGQDHKRWERIWQERHHEILDTIKRSTPHSPSSKKDGLAISDLADLVDLPPRQALEFVDYMRKKGANITAEGRRLYTRKYLPVTKWTHTDLIDLKKVPFYDGEAVGLRVGLISDTHFGSPRSNLAVLREAYRYFAGEGIEHVLHAGNVLAGKAPKTYQETDRVVVTLDDQLDLFLNNYPRYKGITTHFIVGHADKTFQREHQNPGLAIEDLRDDFDYLGIIEADLVFEPVDYKPFRIRLANEPQRYTYGVSYQPQKQADNVEGGDKPNIWLIGGTQQFWMSPYDKKMRVVTLPGLQNQTMQMRDRGYLCNVGAKVMTIVPTSGRPRVFLEEVPAMGSGPAPEVVR